MDEFKKQLEAQIEKLTDKIFEGDKEVYLPKEVIKMLRDIRSTIRNNIDYGK